MSTVIRTIAPGIALHDDELEWQATRARGPGGQHVNKASTAVELRFDIGASRLPEAVRRRLTATGDRRITSDGVVVIRAASERSQKQNRREALDRLTTLIASASEAPVPRVATKTPARARRQRLADKRQRAETKRMRGSVRTQDHD